MRRYSARLLELTAEIGSGDHEVELPARSSPFPSGYPVEKRSQQLLWLAFSSQEWEIIL